jgi:hypothetical protein
MPEEIDLTPEDHELLDQLWTELREEAKQKREAKEAEKPTQPSDKHERAKEAG